MKTQTLVFQNFSEFLMLIAWHGLHHLSPERITDILQDALEAESPALTIEGSKLMDAMEDEESRSLLFHAGQRCRLGQVHSFPSNMNCKH